MIKKRLRQAAGYHVEGDVIRDSTMLVGLNPTDKAQIQSWFTKTKNLVPAIVTDKGELYSVQRAERTPAEAKAYEDLALIMKEVYGQRPVVKYCDKSVLKSGIDSLKPDNVEHSKEAGYQAIKGLVHRALELKATDLHLEAVGENASVRYRVYGQMVNDASFNLKEARQIQSALFQLLIKGQHDSSPAKKGFFHMKLNNQTWMCRVSYGESAETQSISLVIRFRNMQEIPEIEELGHSKKQTEDILNSFFNRGFTLVFGPTNSGKSTTSGAIMLRRPSTDKNVEISAETELMFSNFVQLVLPNTGPPDKLKEWRDKMIRLPLQQDVDFLAVNEINNQETADIVARLMLQGASGISTVHGANIGDIINRLKSEKDLGISEEILFSDSFFNLLIYQVLVGKLCPHCRLKTHPESQQNERLKRWFGVKSRFFRFENPEGCQHCEVAGKRLGVIDLALVSEVIPISQDNREYLKRPDDSQPMREWLYRTGRQTIHMRALDLAYKGIIDPVETQKIIGMFSRFNVFDLIHDEADEVQHQRKKDSIDGIERAVEA